MRLIQVCLSAVFLLLLSLTASAQTEKLQQDVNAQTAQIASFADYLNDSDNNLAFVRRTLSDARNTGLSLEKSLSERVTNLQERLKWLGDSLEGESAAVTRQRAMLSEELTTAQLLLNQTKRNIAEIARIENELSLTRQESRISLLMQRSPSPISWDQIKASIDSARQVWPRMATDLKGWYNQGVERNGIAAILIVVISAIALAAALTFMFRGWVDTQIFRKISRHSLSTDRSILLGLMKIAIRTLPVFLGGLAIYQALSVLGLLSGASASMARTIWFGVTAISMIDSAGRTFLTPRDMRFRLIRTGDRRSALLRLLFTLTACVLFLDIVLFVQLKSYRGTGALQLELMAIVTLCLIGLSLALSRRGNWKNISPDEKGREFVVNEGWLKILRNGLQIGFVLLIFATLLGYVNLAHYLAKHVCLSVALVLAILALRTLSKSALVWFSQQFGSRSDKDEDKEEPATGLWMDLLVDVSVLFLAIPAFLLVLGLSLTDLAILGERLIGGFQVGKQHFSLVQIVVGILAFLLLMSITRLFQRVTDKRVLSRMRVDEGVRSSLKTLIGYVGLVIAFMTGVGLIGFDLSNLAIIAGALSVGIGFGLQSIVNNFVSGLILLFERPIKVGDWVVTSSGEGIVKKISVRSTEIETFDRASILVPNSELISSSVTNWTHKNKLGRVTVAVGVAYHEDPDKILEILSGIPKKVDIILNYPEALVLFTGFGDSSLDFEIRAFIADVSNSLKARTAIRLEIFKAFREAGVEIPFPQRDLHLRSVDGELVDTMRKPSSDPTASN